MLVLMPTELGFNLSMNNSEYIMQMRPFFGDEEANAVFAYMKSDAFVTEFKKTTEFEDRLAEFIGVKHCIATNNGTISLTLAALALGISPNDEVIVPNYTMIATPNSVKMIGAKPVFVDVDRDNLCLDLALFEAAITDRTKAVILVSANGRYPNFDLNLFREICKINNIQIIEDAAQSLGSFFPNNSHIGTFGKIGSFSFSAPKIISTGQGGCLVTDDDQIASKLRKIKDFGRSGGGTDVHDSIGYNFKFTDIQAVIGLEQLKKLPKRIERKKEIWLRYAENLTNIDEVKVFKHNLDCTAPWFIDVVAENRKELSNFLHLSNIGSRVMYPQINKQLAYRSDEVFPVSKLIEEKGLWLPSMVQLENSQIDYICNKVSEFYANN